MPLARATEYGALLVPSALVATATFLSFVNVPRPGEALDRASASPVGGRA